MTPHGAASGRAPGRMWAMAPDSDWGPRMLDPHDQDDYPLATPADRRYDARALAEHAFHLNGTDYIPTAGSAYDFQEDEIIQHLAGWPLRVHDEDATLVDISMQMRAMLTVDVDLTDWARAQMGEPYSAERVVSHARGLLLRRWHHDWAPSDGGLPCR